MIELESIFNCYLCESMPTLFEYLSMKLMLNNNFAYGNYQITSLLNNVKQM